MICRATTFDEWRQGVVIMVVPQGSVRRRLGKKKMEKGILRVVVP